jgi:hypothetical protein
MPQEPIALSASLEDLKLVYRVLHAHLVEHLELMDSEVFSTLQQLLQDRAKVEGVDATDHAAWDAWLGNDDAMPCDERMRARRILPS